MNETVIQLQPAFIMQHKKFRETSIIMDVFTRDFGIVSILAKGVRKKKSKTAGILLAFNALKLSYMGKNELKLLTHVELDSSIKKLQSVSLYCGYYINELICCLLHKHDPHPEVFAEYKRRLILLADAKKIEENLRFFELNLLHHIGYGVQLTIEANSNTLVNPFKKYYFGDKAGMIESEKGYIYGKTLLALDARNTLNTKALYESKHLMRQVINFQLQGKQLKSRVVLAKIIKQL
jgi:DNA repair protein RecO (recombination protein O)